MTFDRLVEKALKREGGYVNHPHDRGAATNYGITQRVYTMWRNGRQLGYADVRNITRAEAKLIYLEQYWRPAGCDDLPEPIRDLHFDAAVNHGVKRAALFLQEACRTELDGYIGPLTLSAARAVAPQLLHARYLSARYRFYGAIINRDRSQLAFIVGWMNRMAEFAHYPEA